MTDEEHRALLACVRPAARIAEDLPVAARMMLWASMLAQEICTLPPDERDEVLRDWIADFPAILRSTESGMRNALAENARRGE